MSLLREQFKPRATDPQGSPPEAPVPLSKVEERTGEQFVKERYIHLLEPLGAIAEERRPNRD